MSKTFNARRAFFVGKTGKILKVLLIAGLLSYPASIQAETLALGFQPAVQPHMLAMANTPEETSSAGANAMAAAATAQIQASTDASSNDTRTVWVTAYTSDPDETSDHPLITASGAMVRDGVIAANFLPFGTQIKIPALFGDKIFTVEDRTSQKFSGRVDIWMPTYSQAVVFGIRHAAIVVLDQNLALQ
jgi:3D (Asp-Asp-Asp) domain-containing protein